MTCHQSFSLVIEPVQLLSCRTCTKITRTRTASCTSPTVARTPLAAELVLASGHRHRVPVQSPPVALVHPCGWQHVQASCTIPVGDGRHDYQGCYPTALPVYYHSSKPSLSKVPSSKPCTIGLVLCTDLADTSQVLHAGPQQGSLHSIVRPSACSWFELLGCCCCGIALHLLFVMHHAMANYLSRKQGSKSTRSASHYRQVGR